MLEFDPVPERRVESDLSGTGWVQNRGRNPHLLAPGNPTPDQQHGADLYGSVLVLSGGHEHLGQLHAA